VKVHADDFEADVRDEAWLGVAGSRRWVALTKDARIRTNASSPFAMPTE
jgi:hypothetical protein